MQSSGTTMESDRRRPGWPRSLRAAALLAALAVVLVWATWSSRGLTVLAVGVAGFAFLFGLWRIHQARVTEAVTRNDARFALLLDHADDIIMFFSPDGRILQANRRAAEEYGYRLEEMVGMDVRELRSPATRDQVGEQLARVMEQDRLRFEVVHVRRDGSEFPVEIHSRRVMLDGQPTIIAIMRDLTARRTQQDALRKSEERFRLLAEHAQDVIYRYRLTPTPGFEYVSPAIAAASGYTPQEFYADPALIRRIVHPEDLHVLEASLARAASNQDVPGVPTTLRWIQKDGATIWTELRSVVVRDETGGVVALQGVVRDVSERMSAQQRLRDTERQLVQSQRLEAVGRLAAGIAHDFNNLLTVITGYADLIARDVGGDGQVLAAVGEVRAAADRAASLTRQLLAFSRQQVLQPRVISLNEIVADVSALLKRVIGEDVALVTKTDPQLGNVEVDQAQIEQVLMNLAVNARDAMPRGGTLTIETANADLDTEYARAHPPVQPGPYVRLAVGDTGIGMTREVQARIFEPFFSTKPAAQGSGLGLSTVYGIVKQSGGYIWVHSEPGKGASFEIYLPRVDQVAAAEVPRPVAAPDASSGGETVLVVEDQPMLRSLVRRVLEQHGYRVLAASTGAEAVEAAREIPLDLLLTDVVLPDFGGPEVANQLRRLRPDLRVVFMSGYAHEALDGRVPADDTASFLPKPFTPDSLLEKVRDALRG